MAFVELPCVPRESCVLQVQFVVEVEEKTIFFPLFIYLTLLKWIFLSSFSIPVSGFLIPDSGLWLLGLPFQSSLVCSGEVILLIQTLTIASEFAIIVTGVPCALTFKKWFIFQGLLCSQREGMFFIFVTLFVAYNACPNKLFVQLHFFSMPLSVHGFFFHSFPLLSPLFTNSLQTIFIVYFSLPKFD